MPFDIVGLAGVGDGLAGGAPLVAVRVWISKMSRLQVVLEMGAIAGLAATIRPTSSN